jgi:hypothetical protein
VRKNELDGLVQVDVAGFGAEEAEVDKIPQRACNWGDLPVCPTETLDNRALANKGAAQT